ncbi:MAG: PASTA domain-containing protein [Clostridiales bacterium]|nr:PASTA domain-containing protein [Clostridiales bacterium]
MDHKTPDQPELSGKPEAPKKPRRPLFPRLFGKSRRSDGTTTNSVFTRTIFVMTILGFVAFALLIAKLFQVQLVDYEVYQRNAVSQQTRNEVITPSRGTIYDVNGKQLAVSATVETVILNPAGIKDAAEKRNVSEDALKATICQGLSEILSLDYDKLLEKANKTSSQYEYVARKIDIELADRVRTFITKNKLSGVVYLITDTKRYYPYGNFLSHVLGFCGIDNDGLYGIEYYFDDDLKGEPGRIISAKNGRGVDMPFDYEQYYSAQDGDSIELTIDEVIQHYLERHLEECYAWSKAAVGVTGIVMDVENAAVLGMACKPDFDLNSPFEINDETLLFAMEIMDDEQKAAERTNYLQNLWSNRAVNATYESGSVFKILTGAMSIEENIIGADELFYCGGSKSVELSGETIGCWSTHGHGQQTFEEGVMQSCNCVFITLGLRMGPATFFKYYKAFGLTQKTGITLPGEAGGSSALYFDTRGLSVDVQLANAAFGQSNKVTPIQIITAVSAVANGGTLYQPRIVSRIIAADGSLRQDSDPVVVRQVITEQTSKRMNAALEQVVSGESGTGRNAYVKGYRVAGKTGTSQKLDKLDEEGEANLRIVSFLAFAPADDPKVAVLIIVDEPTEGLVSGGAMAAPVAADVLSDVLPYLGVEPIYTEEELLTLDIFTPDFTGMTVEEVNKRAASDGLTVTFVGEGDRVTDQLPAPGSMVPRNVTMTVYLSASKPDYDIVVPNLVGMTYSGIAKLLRGSTYYIRAVNLVDYSSKKLCVKQTPEAGEVVKPGTVITLDFLDSTIIE